MKNSHTTKNLSRPVNVTVEFEPILQVSMFTMIVIIALLFTIIFVVYKIFLSPLPIPKDLKIGTLGTDNVTLTWNRADSDISYQVYYYTQNVPCSAKTWGDPTTATTMRVDSLASNTDYYFWVSSRRGSRESEKSKVQQVKTALPPPPPPSPRPNPLPPLSPPRKISIVTVGTDHVTLQWDNADFGLTYRVYWHPQNNPAAVRNVNVDRNFARITGLTANTAYTVWVTTVQGNRESNKSTAVPTRTTFDGDW